MNTILTLLVCCATLLLAYPASGQAPASSPPRHRSSARLQARVRQCAGRGTWVRLLAAFQVSGGRMKLGFYYDILVEKMANSACFPGTAGIPT